ncbi:MAG: hypothetical protein WDO24_30520 [Pseudomonadota bacterium]
MRFYGTAPDHVVPLARSCGVERWVEVCPSVPYRESVRDPAGPRTCCCCCNGITRSSKATCRRSWFGVSGGDAADPRPRPARWRAGRGDSRGAAPGLFANDPRCDRAAAPRLARPEAADRRRAGASAARPAPAFSRAEQFERLLGFLDGLVAAN